MTFPQVPWNKYTSNRASDKALKSILLPIHRVVVAVPINKKKILYLNNNNKNKKPLENLKNHTRTIFILFAERGLHENRPIKEILRHTSLEFQRKG